MHHTPPIVHDIIWVIMELYIVELQQPEEKKHLSAYLEIFSAFAACATHYKVSE